MRKKGLAAAVVVLVGGGYIIGQAVSSQVFEREIARTIDSMNAGGKLRIERRDVDSGWFTSRGTLRITPLTQAPWQATLPYRADHGVLSTSMDGELELDILRERDQEEGAQTIRLDELLGADPLAWQVNYHTLSNAVDGELVLDAFSNQTSEGFLEGKGATITLEGTQNAMALEGTIAPWSFSDQATSLELAQISFASNYRQEAQDQKQKVQGHLALDGIQLQQPGGPEVEIDELRYEGTGKLGADELEVTSRLLLSEMRVDGQPAFAGELDLNLSRIDADAYRDFVAGLRRELDTYVLNRAPASDDDGLLGDDDLLNDRALMTLLETLEPQILAMLANSPRLTLKQLSLVSPVLDIRSQLSGELRFAAENRLALSPGKLDSPAERRRWQRHLNGQFLWQGVPPLVALQLGLPLDDDTLDIVIEAGRVFLDGQPLPALF